MWTLVKYWSIYSRHVLCYWNLSRNLPIMLWTFCMDGSCQICDMNCILVTRCNKTMTEVEMVHLFVICSTTLTGFANSVITSRDNFLLLCQMHTCSFTLISDHNVVIVAVTYTQHIGSYTVAGARVYKLLHSLKVLLHRCSRQKEENDQISACQTVDTL